MTDRRDTIQRRLLWATLLLMTCTRVFAGAPEVDGHSHATGESEHPHAILIEHDHVLAGHGNADTSHFHCHSGCGDAPLAIPSVPVIPSTTVTPTRLPSLGALAISYHSFAHFRPPRA